MKLQSLQTIFLLILVICNPVFGQEILESDNWIGIIEGGTPPFILNRFDRYSKADLAAARRKFESLRNPTTGEGWSGTYDLPGELSDNKLIWSPAVGFVSYHIYTCAIELRSLNHGRVVENADSVVLFTEKEALPYPFMGDKTSIRLIKVKWGDRRYLVEEDELKTFGELAAGYYSSVRREATHNGRTYEYDHAIWNSTWQSSKNATAKAFGSPVFPERFRHLVRKPLEGRIVTIGRYEKDKPTKEPVSIYSRQYVSINLGISNGVQLDMEFYVAGIKDRIRIVRVRDKSAVAVLERMLDSDTWKDLCFENYETATCRKIEVGMTAQTVPDELLDIADLPTQK